VLLSLVSAMKLSRAARTSRRNTRIGMDAFTSCPCEKESRHALAGTPRARLRWRRLQQRGGVDVRLDARLPQQPSIAHRSATLALARDHRARIARRANRTARARPASPPRWRPILSETVSPTCSNASSPRTCAARVVTIGGCPPPSCLPPTPTRLRRANPLMCARRSLR
jgi:hypothetical protein